MPKRGRKSIHPACTMIEGGKKKFDEMAADQVISEKMEMLASAEE